MFNLSVTDTLKCSHVINYSFNCFLSKTQNLQTKLHILGNPCVTFIFVSVLLKKD